LSTNSKIGCTVATAKAVLAVATVIALMPGAWAASKYKVLYSFGNGKDGGGLLDSVTFDQSGNLYGTALGGGANGFGTVFMLTPGFRGKWAETILHNFCSPSDCSDGGIPRVGVTFDAAGNFYGSSNTAAFEMTPDSAAVVGWSFQVIFSPGSAASMILDQAGNLYGPMGPGEYGKGAVTELSPDSSGWTETHLYSFCPKPLNHCLDGDAPDTALTWDAKGNLYGGTLSGGKARLGVLFELERTAGGWKEHVLHDFPAHTGDGWNPHGPLIFDQKGNMYGTTSQGGPLGYGTVFKLTRGSDGRWKETILYDLRNPFQNGGGTDAGVIFDRLGNLWGTTPGGGDPKCQCGVVFKMTPGAKGKWKYTAVHRFHYTDGFDPEASLILDSKGNLYGTTANGGKYGGGVVFEITP
jgi:uncharacterized repeat protein (TIGR03803 family)